MRRVLQVIHTPSFGGPHNQALRLDRALRARGWETLVVLPEEPGSGSSRLLAAGVRVHRMPMGRARATPNPIEQVRFAVRLRRDVTRLRRLIRESAADVVQVHGVQNPLGALAGRREGVAVVWQLLGTSAPAWLRRVATPPMLRLADVVMTTGTAVAEAHPGVTRLAERWVTFYPPLDLELFRPDARRRASARRELGVGESSFLVGTVGNYFRAKAHEDLVETAALVAAEMPAAFFRILGQPTPTHAAYYTREVRERARRLGLLDGGRLQFVDPGERVAELMPAFDLFVLSSIAEGVPNVLLEAMGCGLPIVTTDVGSIGEVVVDQETGLLVPPRDPPTAARAVLRLARDAGLRDRMGTAARRLAERTLGTEACAARHEQAYRRALLLD